MKSGSHSHSPRLLGYGSWASPITADLVTSSVVGLGEVQLAGSDLYWLEQRPSENGRSVIVRATPDGTSGDIIPAPFNARTRVHEYGGGSYLAADDAVYFSNFSDNGLYSVVPGSEPSLVLPLSPRRYADFLLDEKHDRLICVCEDHSVQGSEPSNTLIAISLNDGSVQTLAEGSDFYASPTLSPDGTQLAWLSWEHPNMPWDGTSLHAADLNVDGSVLRESAVAGGSDESIFQPQWSPDGVLYYVSDRNGWWNLYRLHGSVVENIWANDAEFGEPQWVFRQSTYGFANARTLICTYTQGGAWYLASIDTVTSKVSEIETEYTVVSSVEATGNRCAFIGASPSQMPAVITLDLSIGKYEIIRRSSNVEISEKYISIAESVRYATADGGTAYANYYPPKNDDFYPPDGELPPLLVACHGGPTSASYSQLNLTVQFWTSRGFAFVHVNYGGSTGYGREYRDRLNGMWGIVDVDDCIDCALALAEDGKADGNRLTIHGGSAGGYTALCALTFHKIFAAGASLYGVSDLEALTRDTHKFESRYLDRLIGKYPERKDLYIERSPIHFVDQLSSPVIFFQGLDDKVVPPDQAGKMVDALKQQNIPVEYVAFEGEGHGFRKSESIKTYLNSHLKFYADVFGIELGE